MLEVYVRHGMIVDKVHETISFKQIIWLEKYIDFHAKKRAASKNDFQIEFHKQMPNSFYGKCMEKVKNRNKIEPIKKDERDKMVKWQSKLSFNGIYKIYENYVTFTFKQNETTINKPNYLGFAVLELSKLHMYDTCYDKLQPYFGEKIIQLHYIDTDSFVLSVKAQNIFQDLHNLKDLFDFSNLDSTH